MAQVLRLSLELKGFLMATGRWPNPGHQAHIVNGADAEAKPCRVCQRSLAGERRHAATRGLAANWLRILRGRRLGSGCRPGGPGRPRRTIDRTATSAVCVMRPLVIRLTHRRLLGHRRHFGARHPQTLRDWAPAGDPQLLQGRSCLAPSHREAWVCGAELHHRRSRRSSSPSGWSDRCSSISTASPTAVRSTWPMRWAASVTRRPPVRGHDRGHTPSG